MAGSELYRTANNVQHAYNPIVSRVWEMARMKCALDGPMGLEPFSGALSALLPPALRSPGHQLEHNDQWHMGLRRNFER